MSSFISANGTTSSDVGIVLTANSDVHNTRVCRCISQQSIDDDLSYTCVPRCDSSMTSEETGLGSSSHAKIVCLVHTVDADENCLSSLEAQEMGLSDGFHTQETISSDLSSTHKTKYTTGSRSNLANDNRASGEHDYAARSTEADLLVEEDSIDGNGLTEINVALDVAHCLEMIRSLDNPNPKLAVPSGYEPSKQNVGNLEPAHCEASSETTAHTEAGSVNADNTNILSTHSNDLEHGNLGNAYTANGKAIANDTKHAEAGQVDGLEPSNGETRSKDTETGNIYAANTDILQTEREEADDGNLNCAFTEKLCNSDQTTLMTREPTGQADDGNYVEKVLEFVEVNNPNTSSRNSEIDLDLCTANDPSEVGHCSGRDADHQHDQEDNRRGGLRHIVISNEPTSNSEITVERVSCTFTKNSSDVDSDIQYASLAAGTEDILPQSLFPSQFAVSVHGAISVVNDNQTVPVDKNLDEIETSECQKDTAILDPDKLLSLDEDIVTCEQSYQTECSGNVIEIIPYGAENPHEDIGMNAFNKKVVQSPLSSDAGLLQRQCYEDTDVERTQPPDSAALDVADDATSISDVRHVNGSRNVPASNLESNPTEDVLRESQCDAHMSVDHVNEILSEIVDKQSAITGTSQSSEGQQSTSDINMPRQTLRSRSPGIVITPTTEWPIAQSSSSDVLISHHTNKRKRKSPHKILSNAETEPEIKQEKIDDGYELASVSYGQGRASVIAGGTCQPPVTFPPWQASCNMSNRTMRLNVMPVAGGRPPKFPVITTTGTVPPRAPTAFCSRGRPVKNIRLHSGGSVSEQIRLRLQQNTSMSLSAIRQRIPISNAGKVSERPVFFPPTTTSTMQYRASVPTTRQPAFTVTRQMAPAVAHMLTPITIQSNSGEKTTKPIIQVIQSSAQNGNTPKTIIIPQLSRVGALSQNSATTITGNMPQSPVLIVVNRQAMSWRTESLGMKPPTSAVQTSAARALRAPAVSCTLVGVRPTFQPVVAGTGSTLPKIQSAVGMVSGMSAAIRAALPSGSGSGPRITSSPAQSNLQSSNNLCLMLTRKFQPFYGKSVLKNFVAPKEAPAELHMDLEERHICEGCSDEFLSEFAIKEHYGRKAITVIFQCKCDHVSRCFYNLCSLASFYKLHTENDKNVIHSTSNCFAVSRLPESMMPNLALASKTKQDQDTEKLPEAKMRSREAAKMTSGLTVQLSKTCKTTQPPVSNTTSLVTHTTDSMRSSCADKPAIVITSRPVVLTVPPAIDNNISNIDQKVYEFNAGLETFEAKCSECHSTYRKKRWLASHFTNTHGAQAQTMSKHYKCEKCLMVMPNGCAYRSHVRIHNKRPPFVCPDCGHCFLHCVRDVFLRHVKEVCLHFARHAKVGCELCDTQLATDSLDEVTRHLISSHTSKFHKCLACPMAFTSKSGVEKHVANAHAANANSSSAPTSSTINKCPVCETVFEKVVDLREHVQRHVEKDGKYTVSYTFRCLICKVECLRQTEFLEHMKSTHPGDIIIGDLCEVCGAICDTKHSFYMHVSAKHPQYLQSVLDSVKKDPYISKETKLAASSALAKKLPSDATMSDVKLECTRCQITFDSVAQHRRHHARHKFLESKRTANFPPSEDNELKAKKPKLDSSANNVSLIAPKQVKLIASDSFFFYKFFNIVSFNPLKG